MKFSCSDLRRLEVIDRLGSANAIEFLEVRDGLEPDPSLRQRTLFVRLLRPDFALDASNVRIDGGERLKVISVEWASAADDLPPGIDASLIEGVGELPRTLVVRTATSGDFSRYTLRLQRALDDREVPAGFDPVNSSIEFSFKVECPTDFDCADRTACLPQERDTPVIDYLAKDYTGFRRLMLDRLDLLSPDWTERSAADAGIALVELLAYAADNLSYRQDAIATEAYLATARKRISVRRHARLVDYALHEGCNARAWVRLEVALDHTLPKGTQLLTKSLASPAEISAGSRSLSEALAGGALTFETTHDIALFSDLNRIDFYTWGDVGCCLPRGATSASLEGRHPELVPGAVLIFQELLSPTTGMDVDADPAKRWAVRLVDVTASVDPSGGLFGESLSDSAVDVTEIRWHGRDALPFALCVSVPEHPGRKFSKVFGNNVLVDHGRTMHEPLPEVSHSRYRPVLSSVPVTSGGDVSGEFASPAASTQPLLAANESITRDAHAALPQIVLHGESPSGDGSAPVETVWTAQNDLLNSSADDTHFVVECDNDGTAVLRFGDDLHGQRPNAGIGFTATYRVGNGTAGNVGAETICHIVSDTTGVFTAIVNPMPAAGGVDPESIEMARRDAPEAFRKQERAVTAADYASVVERRQDVQRAAATFRWTGSWHTVFVAADRLGGADVDSGFESELRRGLERFRMAGHDLEVEAPRYAALDIVLHICVLPNHFCSEVVRAVREELGSGVLPDGRLGAFHPDNFTFGQPVYLSRIIARAQQVQGVESVSASKFQRMAAPDRRALATGVIPVGRLEIAMLQNDPNYRDRGRLVIQGGGGR